MIRTSFVISLLLSVGGTAPLLAQETPAQNASDQPAATEQETPSEMALIEQAYARGDFVAARDGLRKLAETPAAKPLALYRYGRILFEGRGGPQDVDAAQLWLTRAAEAEYLGAGSLLARLLLSKNTTERDPKRAADLLSVDATRGHAEAQYYLGLLYLAGDGVAADPIQGANWMRAAATQQHVAASYELGRMLLNGTGVEKDLAEAEKWIIEAATAGHTQAQLIYAGMLEQGTENFAPNPTKSLSWYTRAAEGGSLLAQRMLGTKYLLGNGVAENHTEARRWLTQAAMAGEPGAQLNLAHIYAKGLGVPQDDTRAFQWYQAASDAGLGRATLILARLHEAGRGTPVNLAKAVEIYWSAADSGSKLASAHLGHLTGQGALDRHVDPEIALPWVLDAIANDDEDALTWLRTRAETGDAKAQNALGMVLLERGEQVGDAITWVRTAAEAGQAHAQYQLGDLYSTGQGVEQDYITAHSWLNLAAAQGHQAAAQARDILSDLMTPQEVASAQAMARAFFEASPQGQTLTNVGREAEQ